MPLTSNDVRNKRFGARIARRGYAEEEVDDFLDEVVAALDERDATLGDLRDLLTAAERELATAQRDIEQRASERTHASTTPEAAAELLAIAQKAAAENVATAQAKAAELLDSSCLLYTSPSPRDRQRSRMPSSA